MIESSKPRLNSKVIRLKDLPFRRSYSEVNPHWTHYRLDLDWICWNWVRGSGSYEEGPIKIGGRKVTGVIGLGKTPQRPWVMHVLLSGKRVMGVSAGCHSWTSLKQALDHYQTPNYLGNNSNTSVSIKITGQFRRKQLKHLLKIYHLESGRRRP